MDKEKIKEIANKIKTFNLTKYLLCRNEEKILKRVEFKEDLIKKLENDVKKFQESIKYAKTRISELKEEILDLKAKATILETVRNFKNI